MALSFESVKKAYTVFHEIKKLIPLSIDSFPDDMSDWDDKDKDNPELNKVFGWSKKYDNGWESISFFVKAPTQELIKKFDELKDVVPNTSISEPYHRNEKIWCFGWF